MRDGITIAVEKISNSIESEFWPLLEMHREELATNKQLMVLSPDVARYTALEESGVLFALVMRLDGKAIGYSVNFLSSHLHYSALVYAHNDVLFLHPAYRSGDLGRQLLEATEVESKERGAQMLIWHAKKGTALERILPRWGYGVQDILFSKEL